MSSATLGKLLDGTWATTGGDGEMTVSDRADAGIQLAAQTILSAAFGRACQRCTATSRVIVERRVVGNQSEVIEHLERARNDEVRIPVGGGGAEPPELAAGCYVGPTVIECVTWEMSIWREAVSGLALAVIECDGLEKAAKLVNHSVYGLSAAVLTRDLGAAAPSEECVDTGQVLVTLPASGWDVHQPSGGFLDSGSGRKEQGVESPRVYTRMRTAAVRST